MSGSLQRVRKGRLVKMLILLLRHSSFWEADSMWYWGTGRSDLRQI